MFYDVAVLYIRIPSPERQGIFPKSDFLVSDSSLDSVFELVLLELAGWVRWSGVFGWTGVIGRDIGVSARVSTSPLDRFNIMGLREFDRVPLLTGCSRSS